MTVDDEVCAERRKYLAEYTDDQLQEVVETDCVVPLDYTIAEIAREILATRRARRSRP
jgi:hypothetical protein